MNTRTILRECVDRDYPRLVLAIMARWAISRMEAKGIVTDYLCGDEANRGLIEDAYRDR